MLATVMANWALHRRKRDQKKKRADFRRGVESAGVWFVDIPRTGSTSLKRALASECGQVFEKSYLREKASHHPCVVPDHATAREVKDLLGPDLWNGLFSFSIVRNPWDRMLSLYRYRLANGDFSSSLTLKDYLRQVERLDTRHPASPFVYEPYYRSMADALLDEKDHLLVKWVGRYEEMDDTISELRRLTGLKLDLSHRYESLGNGSDYRQAYDEESAAIIGRIYTEDIQRFGYSFD